MIYSYEKNNNCQWVVFVLLSSSWYAITEYFKSFPISDCSRISKYL